MSDLVIGQILLFCTTLIGFGYQAWRDARNRRWDLEDRARIAAALDKTVQETAASNIKLNETHNTLVQKLDDNTAVSVSAFTQANAVNEKIASLMKMFEEHKRSATTIQHIDETTKEVLDTTKETLDVVKEQNAGHG